jgi:FAS-associated factor 2
LRGPPQVDPTAAAVCFKTEFNRNYVPDGAAEGDAAEGDHSSSNNSINWLQCGWRQALSRAHSEGRFLFVYLHSPQHQATESYCKDTLLDSIVLEKLNNNSNPSSSSGTGGGSGAGCGFLCWGGDIRRSDAFALSASLRVGGYPYAAVLAYSGPRTRMISCAEGPLTSVELAALLQRALDDYSGLLWQERIEREQREMDRRLREEQDAEYQRSLEADRERDRVREEREKERREAEERERRGAEEVAAAEREAVEREERRVRVIKDRREAKRMTLPPEPTPTTRTTSRIQEEEEEEEGSSSAVAITLVRIKLPSGSQQQRRFYASQQLQAIFDWVDTLEEVEVIKYSLASPYPRRVYKVDDGDGGGGGTLEELGLVGQAVLLLQPEDD